tara:strand:+ start:112 stop:216 length:105 start_codon:yes stop_codon:yes gene_type:complete
MEKLAQAKSKREIIVAAQGLAALLKTFSADAQEV